MNNPQVIKGGDPTILKKVIDNYSCNKVFIVTGKKSFTKSGAKNFIDNVLDGKEYIRFFDFEPNPKIEDLEKAIKVFSQSNCDLIIAIGGGSTIDMAKMISSLSNSKKEDLKYLVSGKKKSLNKIFPIIAIPTTSGSGSEATHFAVVYIDSTKYSYSHKTLIPDTVVLNPELILSQSKYLKACTGLDAFSQAIESYWAVGSTLESMNYAKKAIVLLLSNLKDFVINSDVKTAMKVSYASYLAGKAINISKTTASHAISYAITTKYGIPHGHAVFMTLPQMFVYNNSIDEKSCNDSRGVDYVKKCIYSLCELLDVKNELQAYNKMKHFASDIGIEISFKKNMINRKDINELFNNINIERMNNNPRLINIEELMNLFN